MTKYFRNVYFKYNPWVRELRGFYSSAVFDDMYRRIYRFLSGLYVGQYFEVGGLCRRDPANHDLVLGMTDIYFNMDFFVNLSYDAALDRISVLPPSPLVSAKSFERYAPPDMYSRIVRNPSRYGVNPEWINPQEQNDIRSDNKRLHWYQSGHRIGPLSLQEGIQTI